jgi:cytosine/adenosine deaminase-related metal-dependent hydrolase
VCWLLALLVLATSATHARGAALLIRNARLIDGTGAPARDGVSILVRDAADVGTVEVGKRADLVVVRGDPLGDLRALRRVAWTIHDGVAHTPAEWMEVGSVERID